MSTSIVGLNRRFKVPDASSSVLIEPDLVDSAASLSTPLSIAQGSDFEFCGIPFERVRGEAREEAMRMAVHYTQQYASPRSPSVDEIAQRPIVLTGHQPELFHAGVWFKNFLLARCIADYDAIGINFLVDNDLCRSTAIRVPTAIENHAIIASSVPFDGQRSSIPWELRSQVDRTVWDSFPGRVRELLLPLRQPPLLDEIWKDATRYLKQYGRIGAALSAARHSLELRHGSNSLEVPLSQLVDGQAFARFSVQVLSELPRFQAIYNSQLEQYRQRHRIRSRAHPVSELGQQAGWIEAPWWVYRPESPQRRGLWVRMMDDQLYLTDRGGWQAVIEGPLDTENAADQWLDLLSDGVRLRPRALLTTMYLRLVVGDLFIHGIGGVTYDQLTNEIVREFFGIEPPPMLVASATMHLPFQNSLGIRAQREIENELRKQKMRIWELEHHADHFQESGDLEAQQLIQRKQELLRSMPPRGEKWAWHQQIKSVNQRLRTRTLQEQKDAVETLGNLEAELRQSRIVHSREYSFCLYPDELLVPELKRLAGWCT